MDSLAIFLRPRVSCWILIRYIQYVIHRNNFTSPQNWLCRLRSRISLRHLAITSLLGNIFWRHARFSQKQPEPQNHGDFNVYFLKQQTWLLLHTANMSPLYVQQCLKITIHLSSRHLAAKILSPLYHYFFPFLRRLQHKRKLFIPCCH